jgi:hypothetical protein
MRATKINAYAIAGAGSTNICGSAARTPDGFTVVGWGDLSDSFAEAPGLTEVTPDGDVVLEIAFPPGHMTYRVGIGVQDEDGRWVSAE